MDEGLFGSDQLDGASDNPESCDQFPGTFSNLSELPSHLESPKEERPYKCNQCGKSYRHAGSLVNHKKTHQVGVYTCLICQKEYFNPMGLKNHLRIHSEEKRFRCSDCGECFRMSRQLSNHRKESHGFYCASNGDLVPGGQESMDTTAPVLIESSNLISNLENYIAESVVPGDFSQLISKYYPDVKSEVECEANGENEKTESVEVKDMQLTDTFVERRYKCKQCGKSYKHAGSLANHRQSHKLGVYQCAVCFKEFSNLMAMKNHCRLHSDSRTQKRLKSYSTTNLAGHSTDEYVLSPAQDAELNSRDILEMNEDNRHAVSDASEGSFSEEETTKTPLQKLNMNTGLLSPPANSNSEQTEKEEVLKPVLQASCSDQSAYDDGSTDGLAPSSRPEHEEAQSHSEQQTLEVTDEEAVKLGEGMENRPFMCQVCGKTYRHAGSLINHKKTHQTGVYSCSICSKQLYNMAALKNHLRAHFKSRAGRRLEDTYYQTVSFSDELFNNTEEIYQCDVCNETFTCETDFMQHQSFHQHEGMTENCNDVHKVKGNHTLSNCFSETLQTSQGSSADSAYCSGPSNPNIFKKEAQSTQEGSGAMSLEALKKEVLDDGFPNTLECFQNSSDDKVVLKETDFSERSEHEPVSEDRPYKCDTCGKTYIHKSSLLNHKLTHQTGIYQCSICPKQYSNLMALRNHIRFHSRRSSRRLGSSSISGPQLICNMSKESQNMASPLQEACVDFVSKEEVSLGAQLNESDLDSAEKTKGDFPILCSCGKFFDCTKSFQTHSQYCIKAVTYSSSAEASRNLKGKFFQDSEDSIFKTKVAIPNHGKDSQDQTGRRLYECDLCEKSYRHSGSLINHKRTHQTGDYVCPVCSKHVHNLAALKNHLRIHHKIKRGRPGEMRDCSEFLFSDMSYSQANEGLFGCADCDEIFQSEDDLLSHQELHMQVVGDNWDQVQDSSMELDRENCNDLESLKVSQNGLSLENQERGLYFTENSKEDSSYICQECGEDFINIEELNNHKHTHQTGIYQCSFCPKEYPNLLALKNHILMHTKLQTIRNGNREGSDETENMELADSLPVYEHRYDCGHCGMIFCNEADFHQHQVAHENQDMISSLPCNPNEEPLSEFPFRIHSSERDFLSIKNEMEEGDTHDISDGGPLLSHICGFCGKTYDDLVSLQKHSLSHTEEELCTAQKSPVNGEVEFEDENKQPREHLKVEENPVEPPGNDESQESRPFTCDQCGKTYRHGGSLVNHKKTHLVGIFKCFVCSRQYPNLAAYRNHLRHHPKCKQRPSYSNIQELQIQNPNDCMYSENKTEHVNYSMDSSVSYSNYAVSQSVYNNSNTCSNPVYSNVSSQNYSSVSPHHQTPKNRFKTLGRWPASLRSTKKSAKRRRLVSAHSLDDPGQRTSISDSQYASDEKKSRPICQYCGKDFLCVDDLLNHLSSTCGDISKDASHTGTADQQDVKEEPPISLSGFSQKNKVEETGFHQRPFRCEVCGRSYRHAGSLINHKQTHKTGVFRCAICQKPFFNLMAMKNHNRIHFELKRHKCLDCGKAFRLHKQLETHQRIHREKAAAKRAGRRSRRIPRSRKGSILQRQKSLSNNVPASNVCKDSHVKDVWVTDETKMTSSPERNIKRKRDPDSRPYQCKECGRSYRHAGSLFNHKKSHTMGQYCCSICDKTYPNLMAMKNHQRTHFERKRHICTECGKTFKWKRQLIRHQLVHSRERAQTSFRGSLENDASQMQYDSNDFSSVEATTIVSVRMGEDCNPKRHGKDSTHLELEAKCTDCGILFGNYDELENHMCRESNLGEGQAQAEHGLKEAGASFEPTHNSQVEERPYKCDVCERTYRHAGSLLNHKNTHTTGIYKCSVCLKQFFNPMAMKNHFRTHTAKKRFQCLECGKAFRSSRELICHQRVHTGERPFHCPTCSRGFSSKLTLRHHQRTHVKLPSLTRARSSSPVQLADKDTKDCKDECVGSTEDISSHDSPNPQDERRFKCNQCDRAYRHAGSLLNHRKTHSTGIYQCPDCHKEFFNLLALKNHLRIHRYPCKDCGKAFRIASHLATHLKIHEQGGPFNCQHCSKRFFCRSSFEQHQLTHTTLDPDVPEAQAVSSFMVEVT